MPAPGSTQQGKDRVKGTIYFSSYGTRQKRSVPM